MPVVEPPAVSFAGLLRRLRIDAGLTQEQLAEAAGLSYRSISDLERGINLTPRKETVRLLADALNLVGGDRTAFEATARWRGPASGFIAPAVPSAGVAAATRTLPRDIASFTGREPEFRHLIRTIMTASGPGGVMGICAIGGMAGIGKTAFAVHAAHKLAPQFPDGQIFMPLHGHTPGQQPVSPADALASLLQAAGVAAQQIPAGLEPRAWLWRDHLADKRLLLVLDDAAGHDQVRPLLPGTAGSLVLVTSRRHLTALEDVQVISLDTLPPDDAARLLVRLAARPGLDPGDNAVREISRVCGYLPLAVGMLARQLHHHPAWSAAGLAADLRAARHRLELMRAENLSVAAAFDLSYQDLTSAQQRLFRRLGLHPGTEIDAYAVAALDDSDLDATRRHLDGLYDHYLLAEPARGRYRMHDLIGEHARVLAAADPTADRDAALDRLLGYYLHTARSASRYLTRRIPAGPRASTVVPPAHTPDLSGSKDAAAWMDAESVNLHAAVGYAAAHGLPDYAIAIPAAMHGFLRYRGHLDEVVALHHVALDAARHAGDQIAEANALTDLGDIQHLTGAYPAATASLTRALEIHRSHGDKQGEAHALCILGYIQHLTGDNRTAVLSLTSALDLYRGHGDRLGEAGTLAYLSEVQVATGDYPAAKASLTRALELHHDLGTQVQEAAVLNFLGVVQQATGEYQAAAATQARALQLQREVGNRLAEAKTMRDLGLAQRAAGDYTAATTSLTRALELDRDLGHRIGEARAVHHLSTIQHLTGDYSGAAAGLARALELYRDLGNRLGESAVLNAIGELSLAVGAHADGRAHHEEALAISRAIDSPPEEAHALEGIGRCQLHDGQLSDSAASLRQALTIYERIGSPNASRVRDTLRDHGL